jgi:NAD(P)-dependent dehydrogenase (short-subunit alcohol dehydrogenase family)
VVVAARRAGALEELAQECQAAGGQALAVPTDTTDEAAVAELTRRAVERFGGIDIWVNNAGVYLLGLLEATPPEAFRRVLETNFFGYVHGARAVLPVFRHQGHGVLINNASVYSHVGTPWLTAYVSSKFAVRGCSEEALCQELGDLPDVHICTVSPSPIDTPSFASAATTAAGRSRRHHPPIRPSRWPARSWLAPCIPSGSGSWGAPAAWSRWQKRLPRAGSRGVNRRYVDGLQFAAEPAPATDGNLSRPLPTAGLRPVAAGGADPTRHLSSAGWPRSDCWPLAHSLSLGS